MRRRAEQVFGAVTAVSHLTAFLYMGALIVLYTKNTLEEIKREEEPKSITAVFSCINLLLFPIYLTLDRGAARWNRSSPYLSFNTEQTVSLLIGAHDSLYSPNLLKKTIVGLSTLRLIKNTAEAAVENFHHPRNR